MSLTGRFYEVVPMNSREGRFVVIDKESGKIEDFPCSPGEFLKFWQRGDV